MDNLIHQQVQKNIEMLGTLSDLAKQERQIPLVSKETPQAILSEDWPAYKRKRIQAVKSLIPLADSYAIDFIELVEKLDQNLSTVAADRIQRKVALDSLEASELYKATNYVKNQIQPFCEEAKSLDIETDEEIEKKLQGAIIRADIYRVAATD